MLEGLFGGGEGEDKDAQHNSGETYENGRSFQEVFKAAFTGAQRTSEQSRPESRSLLSEFYGFPLYFPSC